MFACLARRPGVTLRTFYLAEGHADTGWDFRQIQPAALNDPSPSEQLDRRFVPNWTPVQWRRKAGVGYANLSLIRELAAFQPDHLLVYGYNQLAHWLAFSFAYMNGIPFSLRSDSNARLDQARGWRSSARRWLVRRLVRTCHSLLAVGSMNRDYWHRYGATNDQIVMAPFAVDNERIGQLAASSRRHRACNPGDPVHLITVGRLVPRKGIDRLLLAVNTLVGEGCRLQLTVVGDGPERIRLRELQSPSARRVTEWTGKISGDEVASRLGNADLFVHPSLYEPWGLVINEAMAAGVAVLAGADGGAAADLVRPGIDGWHFDDLTEPGVTASLRRVVVVGHERLAAMGCSARKRVAQWSFDRTVDGIMHAVHSSRKTTARVKTSSSSLSWEAA